MHKILVVVHVYYTELWQELCQCIHNLDDFKEHYSYDVIITRPQANAFFDETIRAEFKDVRIIDCENVGYDIWPFFKILKLINLDDYAYLVKLHTKRGMGLTVISIRDKYYFMGNTWRNLLLSFISSKEHLKCVLDAFEKNQDLGLCASSMITDVTSSNCEDKHFAYCFNEAVKLVKNMGLEPYPKDEVAYVGGTMFMVRASLLKPLLKLSLTAKDFMEASRDEVNDLPHILERTLGLTVSSQHYRICDPFTTKLYKLLFVPYSLWCRFLHIRSVRKVRRFIFRIDGNYNEERVLKIFKIKICTFRKKR